MTEQPISVILLPAFVADLKRLMKKYRHARNDIDQLVVQLQAGETPGDQIPGVGYTVFKVRVKSTDLAKGKSSGFRVIYYLKTSTRILLLSMYVKSEQTDIAPETITRIIREYESPQNTESSE